MGPPGGGHDTHMAHRGTDHCGAQRRPVRHRGPRALPQARHLGCHVLYVADQICWARSERCEEASPAGRRKPTAETDGGGASAGHPSAESDQRKKLVEPKAKRAAAQWSTERFGLSQRRVCRLLALDRNTLRAVNARTMPSCEPGFGRLPSRSGGMAVPGSMCAYDERADA